MLTQCMLFCCSIHFLFYRLRVEGFGWLCMKPILCFGAKISNHFKGFIFIVGGLLDMSHPSNHNKTETFFAHGHCAEIQPFLRTKEAKAKTKAKATLKTMLVYLFSFLYFLVLGFFVLVFFPSFPRWPEANCFSAEASSMWNHQFFDMVNFQLGFLRYVLNVTWHVLWTMLGKLPANTRWLEGVLGEVFISTRGSYDGPWRTEVTL